MKEIEHKGIVVSADAQLTRVEIVRSSACSVCHAKELCGFSEEEKKIVEVPSNGFNMHDVGDEVVLCMKKSMGMKAVWIAYVIPLAILVVTVLLASFLGASEPVMGLAALGAVALYYFVIWCMRDKLNDEFIFYIK